MPDDRLFHKRLGHSEKVNRLTDFEDRVWRAYVLSADDFGVMRFSAITLQADHDYLANRTQKAVSRGLERVRDVGLIVTFEHQSRTYCAQLDWQNHQRVKHPRATINPKPDDELLTTFSHATRQLFDYWPGKRRDKDGEDSGNPAPIVGQHFSNISPTVGHLARAGAREEANANGYRLTAGGSEGGMGETATARAGAFCEWYGETHERLVGVAYIGNPRKDYEAACQLVRKMTDQQLKDAALVWFGADDEFAKNGTRTISKFASRASWCLQVMKTQGIA